MSRKSRRIAGLDPDSRKSMRLAGLDPEFKGLEDIARHRVQVDYSVIEQVKAEVRAEEIRRAEARIEEIREERERVRNENRAFFERIFYW
jgi:hypothetical protein